LPWREIDRAPQDGQQPQSFPLRKAVKRDPFRSTRWIFIPGAGAQLANFSILQNAALLSNPQHHRTCTENAAEPCLRQRDTKLPATDGIAPAGSDLDGWIKTEGTPEMKTWVLHKASDGAMVSGIWECTVGGHHATCTACEYVVLIAGRITITPDGGTPVTVKAGDAFVVEKDFKGTWKIEENVRKHFDFVVD